MLLIRKFARPGHGGQVWGSLRSSALQGIGGLGRGKGREGLPPDHPKVDFTVHAANGKLPLVNSSHMSIKVTPSAVNTVGERNGGER